jgi:hypothetical protein
VHSVIGHGPRGRAWLLIVPLLVACGSSSDGGPDAASSGTRGCKDYGGFCDCGDWVKGSDRCDEQSVDLGNGSRCCSYPDHHECTCGGLDCVLFPTFCQCDWTGAHPGLSEQSQCLGMFCRVETTSDTTGVCACSNPNNTCAPGDTHVSICNAATTPGCPPGSLEVDSCQ